MSPSDLVVGGDPPFPPMISARPVALPVQHRTIPEALLREPQWVAWAYREYGPRWRKLPINPATGGPASVTNPSTWGAFQDAMPRVALTGADGIGFMLSPRDPFVALDLDHCRDPQTGEINAFATQIVQQINSYTEITPSQTGLRIVARGQLPVAGRRTAEVELYASERYVTMTGHHLPGTPSTVEDRHRELLDLYHRLFPDPAPVPDGSRSGSPGQPVAPSIPTGVPTATDAAVIARTRSRYGAAFDRLMAGDPSDHDDDESRADLALLRMFLATTQDNDQLEQLFTQSALHDHKWESRPDYRKRTIITAKELGPWRPSPGPRHPTPDVSSRTGSVSHPSPPRSDDLGSHNQPARPQRPRRTGTHDRACRGCGTVFRTKDGYGRCAYCETCRATPKTRRDRVATTGLLNPAVGPTGDGWANARRRVLKRDRWRCYVCSQRADFATHIMPTSRGGTDQDDNIVAACEACHLCGLGVPATDIQGKRAYIQETRKLRPI